MVTSLLSDEINEMDYHIHLVTDRLTELISKIIPESESNLAKSLTLFLGTDLFFFFRSPELFSK